jgi:hypothetical protein
MNSDCKLSSIVASAGLAQIGYLPRHARLISITCPCVKCILVFKFYEVFENF